MEAHHERTKAKYASNPDINTERISNIKSASADTCTLKSEYVAEGEAKSAGKSGKSRNVENTQASGIAVSDEQIEILARRLLPEIKRYFADEGVRQEFEEWRRKREGEV